MVQWLANILKLVVKTAAPPQIGGVLESALTMLHPIDYIHRALKPGPTKEDLPSTSEFVTLRTPGETRANPSML